MSLGLEINREGGRACRTQEESVIHKNQREREGREFSQS
jgi:hypothetical protein